MKTKENYPIDFVVLWVDGSDPKWLAKKKKFKPELNIANEEQRYRDWGIFKYWFRAVEKYAPWVNHIYLVTDNQKPEWLNINHPKLTVVDHTEIMRPENLPTFNSQALEANLHRIPNLSEHFVYFNDDMYINRPIKRSEFFKNSKPVEAAILNSGTGMGHDELYARAMFNDALVINRHFNKRKSIDKNIFKWINPKYGKLNIRTLSQIIYPYFTGYKPLHMPAPMLKSTFEELWTKEKDLLENTSSHKFRHEDDINQYIFSLWQICKNQFTPKAARKTKYIEISDDNIAKCTRIILKKNRSEFCLNDTYRGNNYENIKKEIRRAFDKKLGKKSQYEK